MNDPLGIRKAMIANERAVLGFLSRSMRDKEHRYDRVLWSRAWRNALDRLVAKGLVKYDRERGYVRTPRRAR